MEQFVTLAAIGLIVVGIFIGVRLVLAKRWLVSRCALLRALPWNSEAAPRVIVLIPALREARIIGEALRKFATLRYPGEKVRFVVITSEREFEFGPLSPSTPECADETIKELNATFGEGMFRRVHYPFSEGSKAYQLNYALGILGKQLPEWFSETTYIGLYDADSVSPEDTLMLLAKDATVSGFPTAYQQPTLYLKNFRELPKSLSGVLAGSFAILQTIFSITHEVNSLRLQSRALANGRPTFFLRMRYCVGHGLFIKWPTLERIGLFPEPIEDTRLGHVLSYLKEDIRVLPVFDSCEVTPRLGSFLKQTAVWFVGEAFFLEDWRIAACKDNVPVFLGAWISLHKLYRNGLWLLKGFFFAVTEGLLVIYGHYALAGITAVIFLMVPILVFLTLKRSIVSMAAGIERLSGVQLFWTILVSPIEYVFMSAGPALGLVKLIIRRATGKALALPKTER